MNVTARQGLRQPIAVLLRCQGHCPGRSAPFHCCLAAAIRWSSLNPFDKPEVYKPDLTPPEPADKLYNEGLARLQNGD